MFLINEFIYLIKLHLNSNFKAFITLIVALLLYSLGRHK